VRGADPRSWPCKTRTVAMARAIATTLEYPLSPRSLSSADADPFASFLLSLVGWEFPLSLEQQASVVSMVGLLAFFTILLMVLLLLLHLGGSGETLFTCFPYSQDVKSFVILDEKTDMMDEATLARAELIDGTPRLQILEEARQSACSQAFCPISPLQARPTSAEPRKFVSEGAGGANSACAAPAPTGAFVQSPTARASLNGTDLPAPRSPGMCPLPRQVPTVSGRFGTKQAAAPDPGPPFTAMHADPYSSLQKQENRQQGVPGGSEVLSPATPPRVAMLPELASPDRGGSSFMAQRSGRADYSARSAFEQHSARSGRSPTPRETDPTDSIGWRNKDSPGWYGL
jgi:hypothetical protein